jgi:hypothetical protein
MDQAVIEDELLQGMRELVLEGVPENVLEGKANSEIDDVSADELLGLFMAVLKKVGLAKVLPNELLVRNEVLSILLKAADLKGQDAGTI